VIGLEVSRLVRNSSDWHLLLEICALTDTLILDEDGLYDPAHFNDRLLLGLKGTMSEAELHVMQPRMRGGLLSKARRGELHVPLPVGFQYDTQGQVMLDADHQVQESLRFLFQCFRRLGSASAVVTAFREASLLFPHRPRGGPQDGELTCVKLRISRTLFVLHNPRYAGAFVYGRTRKRKTVEGHLARLPQEEWHTLLIGAHAGYIPWEQYQENQQRLHENAHALGPERRKSPPGEGPALLQGLVLCGVCGERMKVVYHVRAGQRIPDYVCDGRTVDDPQRICQWISGSDVDAVVSDLLLERTGSGTRLGWGGDLPYSDLQATSGGPNLMAHMNRQDLEFTVDDGHLKDWNSTPDSGYPHGLHGHVLFEAGVSLPTAVDEASTEKEQHRPQHGSTGGPLLLLNDEGQRRPVSVDVQPVPGTELPAQGVNIVVRF